MTSFERIFVPEMPESRPSVDMARLKLGEVFNNGKNEYEFICIHCSANFKHFQQFTCHAQQHLEHRARQMAQVKTEHTDNVDYDEISKCDTATTSTATTTTPTTSASMPVVDDVNKFFFDDVADYFDEDSKSPYDDDAHNAIEEEHFDPSKSNPDELAKMNGLINSYCSLDRTTKDLMNPDEYRPLVAGIDYEKSGGRYICLRCNKTVSKTSTLRQHLASHRKTKYYKCPLCDKSFTAIQNTQKHISRVHNTVYSRALIRESQRMSRVQFKTFLEKDYKVTKRQYECYECKKPLSSFNYLKQHLLYHDQRKLKAPRVKIERDGKRYIKCEPCNKFYTVNYIREHMLTHNKDKKPFVCEICGAAFLVAPQLRKHKVRHERKRDFKCDICPVTYTRSTALIKHRRRVHTEPLPFVCKVCGLGYLTERTLQAHMGKHDIKQNINSSG